MSEPQNRLDLYRYVGSAELSADYLAIMRLFSSGLLIDLSAVEIAERLETSGLDADTVEDPCGALVRWGNLVRSVRGARVRTIADWKHARARDQISKLGGRVQRQVEELLATTGVAREVARELLAGTADRLEVIRDLPVAEPADPELLAAGPLPAGCWPRGISRGGCRRRTTGPPSRPRGYRSPGDPSAPPETRSWRRP